MWADIFKIMADSLAKPAVPLSGANPAQSLVATPNSECGPAASTGEHARPPSTLPRTRFYDRSIGTIPRIGTPSGGSVLLEKARSLTEAEDVKLVDEFRAGHYQASSMRAQRKQREWYDALCERKGWDKSVFGTEQITLAASLLKKSGPPRSKHQYLASLKASFSKALSGEANAEYTKCFKWLQEATPAFKRKPFNLSTWRAIDKVFPQLSKTERLFVKTAVQSRFAMQRYDDFLNCKRVVAGRKSKATLTLSQMRSKTDPLGKKGEAGEADTICVCSCAQSRPIVRNIWLCPVHAVEQPEQPLIVSAAKARSLMSSALKKAGFDNRPVRHPGAKAARPFNLHTLRVGGAQCALPSLGVRKVKLIGRWSSDESLAVYLRQSGVAPAEATALRWPILETSLLG
eukprot:gene192-302_t